MKSIGYLPDYDVAFGRRSTARSGGALDLKPQAGQLVPGVIFEVTEPGWVTLDRKEGAPYGYEQFDTQAIDDCGNLLEVTTYRVPTERHRFHPVTGVNIAVVSVRSSRT